jgi:outer membrane protein assembly factor BamB
MRRFVGLGILGVTWGVITVAGAARAENWARFRGPNGTGVSADKQIPVQWTKKNVLWKTALPGAGNSSAVIWGKRLFLQAATDKDRLLLCLSVTNGKELWRRSMAGDITQKHPKNSFASSTPATDGKQVYVMFWDGSKTFLSAYDFDGKLVWRRDLGSFKSQHGPGVSPIVFQDKVVLPDDQDGSSVLIAVEAKTGKPAWKAKRTAFRACYSTPFVLEPDSAHPELIVTSTAGITSYNPQNGKEYWYWTWHFTGMALRTVASAVSGQGIIFAGSGDGSGERNMVAVKASGKGDVTKTNLVWQRKRDFPYVPSMLTRGDHLYCVNDHGIARCHVAKTGETVWTTRLTDAVTASPLLIDGKIYACSEKGDVYVFPAAATFKLLAKNPLGERILATPAVADNRLFIRGENHLFCIGKATEK